MDTPCTMAKEMEEMEVRLNLNNDESSSSDSPPGEYDVHDEPFSFLPAAAPVLEKRTVPSRAMKIAIPSAHADVKLGLGTQLPTPSPLAEEATHPKRRAKATLKGGSTQRLILQQANERRAVADRLLPKWPWSAPLQRVNARRQETAAIFLSGRFLCLVIISARISSLQASSSDVVATRHRSCRPPGHHRHHPCRTCHPLPDVPTAAHVG